MTKTLAATAPEARIPPGKAPMGYAPLVEYARVRNPAGIPSTDAYGQARLDVNGEVIWAQRGELLAIGLWRHAGLTIDQKIILPISEADWESAVASPHGRRFADAALAAGCKCDVPAKVTSL